MAQLGFSEGRLKGFGIGGSLGLTDRSTIGSFLEPDTTDNGARKAVIVRRRLPEPRVFLLNNSFEF